jgi:probable HAF family extracellular repeat protein
LAQDATFELLDPNTTIFDMSADATVLVGTDFTGPYCWTQAGGYVSIGGQGTPRCSEDGMNICANIMDGGYDQAANWLGGTSWNPLGGIGGTSGTSMSTAYDISGDGSKIVGLGWVDAGTAHAFQWDAVNGMVDLGSIGGKSSRANGISADGHVIVGWDQDPSSGWWRAAKWVDGVEELMAPGTYCGAGQGLSSDGTWIVGDNHPDNNDSGWLWSADTGFIQTGTLSGWMFQGHPMDVSEDGKVVVGWSGYFMDQFAMIWTEDTGIVDLKQYLIDNGATIPGSVTSIALATSVSDDGTIITGHAGDLMFGYTGFIATIPPIEPKALEASEKTLSAREGGTVDFTLDAGVDNANRNYALLGSMTGTTPGTTLPGGLNLPLNWDAFTDLTVILANTAFAMGFQGTLDGSGLGAATLDTLGPIPPSSVGAVLDFAFVVYFPYDYVSNGVSLDIVP